MKNFRHQSETNNPWVGTLSNVEENGTFRTKVPKVMFGRNPKTVYGQPLEHGQ